MQITYFAADFIDPALTRRVRVLRQGGATVSLLGFRRSVHPVSEVDGIPTIDLGQTFDGRLGNRLMQVLRRSCDARQWKSLVGESDLLLARNLEMATIALAARTWANSKVSLVYECLDVHASQLGHGLPSKILRGWELRILQRSSALVLSSRAHLNYFNRFGADLPPVILAENKRLVADRRPRCANRRPPWRIGWFGALRCTKSFEILLGLAQRHPGLVDITLRGRPHLPIQKLIEHNLPLANMRFLGPYAQTDLEEIYSACDLTWAIEYAGQNAINAKWALGNRLYEGGFYNIPSIALRDTAMGDWLIKRQTGVVIDDAKELNDFLVNLTPTQYQALQNSAATVPTNDLIWTNEDCQEFVRKLARAKS